MPDDMKLWPVGRVSKLSRHRRCKSRALKTAFRRALPCRLCKKEGRVS